MRRLETGSTLETPDATPAGRTAAVRYFCHMAAARSEDDVPCTIYEISQANCDRAELWPAGDDATRLRLYLEEFLRAGPSAMISNVSCELVVLCVDDCLLLPVTINDGMGWRPRPPVDAAYVASPFAHYVSYTKAELGKVLSSRLARLAARVALAPVEWLLWAGDVDRVVYVNNMLLSTNLYPESGSRLLFSPKQCAAVLRHLRARFPMHAIAWRSVDAHRNAPLAAALQTLGGRPVFSRQVFYQHTEDDAAWHAMAHARAFRSDAGLVRRGSYVLQHVPSLAALGPGELARTVALYNALYLDVYTRHNPQFTERFVALAIASPLFDVFVLRQADDGTAPGRIDGVLAIWHRGGTCTTPVFGYDTSLPAAVGLYRQLSYHVAAYGRARCLCVNASGGAGAFKRQRAGVAAVEQSVVFDDHLAWWRRAAWALVQSLGALASRLIARLEL